MRTVFTGAYKMTCPECGASVVTSYLDGMVWEHCPGCRRHTWDRYDAMLAEEVRLDANHSSLTVHVVN